jgi:hypothetical protein
MHIFNCLVKRPVRKSEITTVGIRRTDHVASYTQELALALPTSAGCSVGIVRSRTKATELFYYYYYYYVMLMLSAGVIMCSDLGTFSSVTFCKTLDLILLYYYYYMFIFLIFICMYRILLLLLLLLLFLLNFKFKLNSYSCTYLIRSFDLTHYYCYYCIIIIIVLFVLLHYYYCTNAVLSVIGLVAVDSAHK